MYQIRELVGHQTRLEQVQGKGPGLGTREETEAREKRQFALARKGHFLQKDGFRSNGRVRGGGRLCSEGKMRLSPKITENRFGNEAEWRATTGEAGIMEIATLKSLPGDDGSYPAGNR